MLSKHYEVNILYLMLILSLKDYFKVIRIFIRMFYAKVFQGSVLKWFVIIHTGCFFTRRQFFFVLLIS